MTTATETTNETEVLTKKALSWPETALAFWRAHGIAGVIWLHAPGYQPKVTRLIGTTDRGMVAEW